MGRVWKRAWPLIAAALCAGCMRSTPFRCDDDTDCGGAGARCEGVGFCSVSDATCAGALRRFSDSAGRLAGTCVEPVEPAASECPSTYAPIAQGTPGHRYRRLTVAAAWDAQVAACAANAPRTFLAIPDNAAELGALVRLSGGAPIWLGLTDRAAEGTFLDVTSVVPSFLPWVPGAPVLSEDNDEDCVAAELPRAIVDEACDQKREAVCECEE